MNRPAGERNIESSWGYSEIETPFGVGFIPRGFRSFKPTSGIVDLALDVADFIADDKYCPRVEIATELPQVWLQSVDDAALKRSLNKVRAVVTVSGQLREEYTPDHASQQFTVFIVETADERSAEALLRLSKRKTSDGFNHLGIRVGRLFALLIARSWFQGVDHYESMASIRRFEVPLTEIFSRHATKRRPWYLRWTNG